MKRLTKIFLITLLALVLAIAGLTIYAKIKYPPERLKAMLISYLAKEYGIRAQIEHLDFSLFSGFALDKTFIFGTRLDSTLAPEWGPLATIEQIKFAYRWRSLLSRRLDIDEIILSQPSLVYRQAADSSSNVDAILAAFANSAATPSDTAATDLPISIQLKTFRMTELKISAFITSVVDTQKILLGPINLAVDQIELDRRANFSGRMKLQCDPAKLSYTLNPVGKGNALRFTANIEVEISGAMRGDSIAATGELAVDHSRVNWGNSSTISLPRLSTHGKVKYDLAASQLLVPDFHFLIDEKELLAARFEMAMQDSALPLALEVEHGAFDLAQLLALARTHTSGEIHAFLQNMECAGVLDFSGSEFRRNTERRHYQVALRGRDLAYTDHATGLKIEGGQMQVDWGKDGKADSTTALAAQLSFAAFAVPMDAQAVLQTGPGELAANLALAPNFLPRHGELNFSWENISGGKLNGHANVDQVKNPSQRGSWLSRTLGEAEIHADAVELAALSANAVAGKISGKLALSGKRLNDLKLTCNLQSTSLTYETEDGETQAPPYDASASAKIRFDPALRRIAIEDGSLQFKPDTAHNLSSVGFHANYDLTQSAVRMELTDAAIDLSHITAALPDTIFKGAESPFKGVVKMQIAGGASANGWLQAFFNNADSLDYSGKFVLKTDSAFYHDLAVGLKADRLQIDSQWSLTPNATIGEYTVFCPAPEMPDYLKQPLPPTNASGKITIAEKSFTITEGKIEIPDWHAAGAYHVKGEFLPAGMQVKTAVDFGLHAPAPIKVDKGITLRGEAQTNFVFEQYIPDSLGAPESARFTGSLQIDGLDVTLDTLLSLRDLNADCYIDQEFDLRDSSLKPSPASENTAFANAGEALLMYDIFGNAGREHVMRKDLKRKSGIGPSRITVGQIEVLGYQISEVAADLEIGNGRFDVPKFSMKLFDGNWVGNLLVGLGNGNPDQISYTTNMQIASLDVSYFRRLSAQLGKKSRISADFALSGMGVSPKKLEEVARNLSGKLNITKIENRVASNLLQVLDPNGTEKGIQNVRLLLKTGWNVKQLTFEMKNGFIYASLAHVKPWYAPFNLSQPLDFARIPVQPYIGTGMSR